MSDEQINAAIAEACGFVGWDEFQLNKNSLKFRFWDYPKNWKNANKQPWCPDFCNDLNAMHEAEKVLTEIQCTFFITHLRERLENHSASRFIWHATARQRAEAFLRTLGKWEEVQP